MAPKLGNAINRFVADCPYVVSIQDLITKTRLELDKGYFLDLYYNETLSKYSYTLILSNKRIVGWDNAPHYPGLATFPHHFHAEDGAVHPSPLTANPEQDIIRIFLFFSLAVVLLACNLSNRSFSNPMPIPTSTVVVAQFSTPEPTITPTPSPDLSYLLTPSSTPTPVQTEETFIPEPTPTQSPEPIPTLETTSTAEPLSTATTVISNPTPTVSVDTPTPEPTPTPGVDFVLRLVQMRTNDENSWDGTLGGFCGSDHSIYVHVVDAQENLLDGVLVGDRYGNFEVPTGVDGPGIVRILVWSATMEVAVMGHQDGTRYISDFSPLLSTLDEYIPLDWLQQGSYCDSPENCQQRVESNQLCRGHYSYDVVFQRTW